MSEAKKRKVHSPEFKAKVGLEAVRGVKTINEIGQEYGVHPVQVGQWKKAIQEQAKTLFEGKRGPSRWLRTVNLSGFTARLVS
jgi:transposase-like protein